MNKIFLAATALVNLAAHCAWAASDVIAIDVGGPGIGSFVSDRDYNGSTNPAFITHNTVNTIGIGNPPPQAVYDTQRYGKDFTYTIPNLTKGATYTVRLDLDEQYFGRAGQRKFNVAINGNPVLTDYDMFAEAGGEFKALAPSFGAAADANGKIIITFTATVNNASVAGIEITSGGTVPPPPPPSGTVFWKAGDGNLGRWKIGNTYQCGTPVNNGASFTFYLAKDGQNCGRNQMQPLDKNGDSLYLKDQGTYTFDFDYIDGQPSGAPPGMGPDKDARSLIFQIHALNTSDGPCVALGMDNAGPSQTAPSGSQGGLQAWTVGNCSGLKWRGTYTPGEHDHWQFKVLLSQNENGNLTLYRNGALVGSWNGATYTDAYGGTPGNITPWFNFGPYKWRWELPNGGGSTMAVVNATLNNFTVTTP